MDRHPPAVLPTGKGGAAGGQRDPVEPQVAGHGVQRRHGRVEERADEELVDGTDLGLLNALAVRAGHGIGRRKAQHRIGLRSLRGPGPDDRDRARAPVKLLLRVRHEREQAGQRMNLVEVGAAVGPRPRDLRSTPRQQVRQEITVMDATAVLMARPSGVGWLPREIRQVDRRRHDAPAGELHRRAVHDLEDAQSRAITGLSGRGQGIQVIRIDRERPSAQRGLQQGQGLSPQLKTDRIVPGPGGPRPARARRRPRFP